MRKYGINFASYNRYTDRFMINDGIDGTAPSLNFWEWGTMSIDNVHHASVAELKLTADKPQQPNQPMGEIIKITDPTVDTNQIVKIIKMYRPKILMVFNVSATGMVGGDLPKNKDDNTMSITSLIMYSCEADVFRWLCKSLPSLERVFVDHVIKSSNSTAADGANSTRCERLKELSIGLLDDANLLRNVHMDALMSLSIYRLADVSSAVVHMENIAPSLNAIRLPVNTIKTMRDRIISSGAENVDVLHIYDDDVAMGTATTTDDIVGVNPLMCIIRALKPRELLLPCNRLDADAIKNLSYLNSIQVLGVCINDTLVDDYNELFQQIAVFHCHNNPQQQMIIDGTSMRLNFNPFSDDNRNAQKIVDQLVRGNLDCCIADECVFQKNTRWPCIVGNVRSRIIRITNDTLNITWSCGHTNSIVLLIRQIIEHMGEEIRHVVFYTTGQTVNDDALRQQVTDIGGVYSFDIVHGHYDVVI